jgi:sugar phosphate permease
MSKVEGSQSGAFYLPDLSTRVRHRVVLVTALMSFLLYLDRFCISFAETFIKQDLGLSDVQMGWVLSAFFWTYALAQVPSGWLSDRFGGRLMLAIYILLWSAFTGLTGLAFGFLAIILLRFGFGFAQAGAYPTSAALVSRWVPFTNRAAASSIIAVGGRVGGAAAPWLTGLLIVWFVPLSVDSKLSRGDLMHVPRLAYEMTYGSNTEKPPGELTEEDRDHTAARVGSRILNRLSPAARDVVAQQAARYETALDEARAQAAAKGQKLGAISADVSPPPEEDVSILVVELNRFIAAPYHFVALDLDEKSRAALEAEGKRLLKQPPQDLSQEETERLNRLLLEAAYPAAIRRVYVAGWRQVMWVYGGLGLIVAGLFWIIVRNRPDQHPRCNPAELELIEQGRPPQPAGGKLGAIPLVPLLKSRGMWLVCVMQVFTNVGWVFLVTWLPRYLESVHRVPVEERKWLALIPIAVGFFGMLLGGVLTDRMTRRMGLRWGRALPIVVSRFLAAGAYAVCFYDPPVWLEITCF